MHSRRSGTRMKIRSTGFVSAALSAQTLPGPQRGYRNTGLSDPAQSQMGSAQTSCGRHTPSDVCITADMQVLAGRLN